MLFTNPFEQEFSEFKTSTLFKELAQKYQPLPYYKKYRLIQRITLIASYVFNLLSGVTASTLIYVFLDALIHNWGLSLLITLLLILLLELLKRKLGGIIFKEYLTTAQIRWLQVAMFAILSTTSVISSYYGSKDLVTAFSATTPVVSGNEVTVLENELLQIDGQIQNARGTKWKGTTTTESQRTINSLSNQKELVLSELFRLKEQTDAKNEGLKQEHESQVKLQANHFALATLFFEVLFLISAFYLEYYDYRSFVEFHKPITSNTKTVATEPKTDGLLVENLVATTDIDPSILIAAIKNAKANLSAYQAKLQQGKGTVKANQAGIERWEAKIKELSDLLPKNGHQEPIN